MDRRFIYNDRMISNVYLNKLLDDKLKSLFYAKKIGIFNDIYYYNRKLTNLVNLIFCMIKVSINV